MNIHFVCTGNVYRSRLAEAYLNSRKIKNLSVSSSGTKAAENICGPICWYAQRIIEVCGMVPFMSSGWRQTTKASFRDVDFTVFMEKTHYDFAVRECDFSSSNFEIWEIPDLEELRTHRIEETVKMVETSERTFEVIKERAEKFIESGLKLL